MRQCEPRERIASGGHDWAVMAHKPVGDEGSRRCLKIRERHDAEGSHSVDRRPRTKDATTDHAADFACDGRLRKREKAHDLGEGRSARKSRRPRHPRLVALYGEAETAPLADHDHAVKHGAGPLMDSQAINVKTPLRIEHPREITCGSAQVIKRPPE